MSRRTLAALGVLAVVAAVAGTLLVDAVRGEASGHTYYVSPTGSDRGPGTQAAPWRTVARVNRAALAPGDTVRFEGGATFTGALAPWRPGVTFTGYGHGLPNLRGGIYVVGGDRLTFKGIEVDGGSRTNDLSAILSSEHGAGSSHIAIEDCVLRRVRIGINSGNPGDHDWTVEHTLIRDTRDSGVIVVGSDMTFTHDTILDTGRDSSIPYPRHGVYAKGPSLVFDDDTIRGFDADGISLRYRSATVRDTTISGGPVGIGWFQEDPRAGTTTITGNHITGTTSAGIYISPSDAAGRTRESFVIEHNTIAPADGPATNLSHTTGTLQLSDNDLQSAP